MAQTNCKGHRAYLPPILLFPLLAAFLLAPPAAAQGLPKGNPIYTLQEGSGFELYADGSLNIGGDVLGSCDTVLETFRRTGEGPPRETYRQVEACEEAGFSVPGSASLPDTGGPPLLVVAAALLLLGGALCSLGVRR